MVSIPQPSQSTPPWTCTCSYTLPRYDQIHDQLLDASHDEYKLYQEQLHLTRTHLDQIIADTTTALGTLSSLTASFKQVDAQTTAFQTQCEGLVEDQTRITTLADDMEQNLRYYLYLEPMTKRLNAPGAANIVRGNEFTDMLANLDSCLEYMQAHPNHRESQTYRSRYRLLLTRALTLIRVHFTNALREIAADVSKRIADRQLNDTTSSALLYAKFRVGAPELKAMGLEIQKRAVVPAGAEPGAEAEYQSLMNELYQSYSATRGRLILPMVTKKIGEIAQAPSSATDLVAFARSSISYIRRICSDESDLWREWFEGDRGMYDYLEAMCEPLYDHLRPRTIHETQILKLCELCTFIQTQYMEEEDEDDEPIEAPKLDFQTLVHPALQDAQNRLVFLSLAILRDDIERYKPQPEDLEYPKDKKQALSGSRSNQPVLSGKKAPKSELPPTPQMPKTPTVVEEDDPDASKWNFNTEAAFKDWYPTLRKAIWLLSKIYHLVHVSPNPRSLSPSLTHTPAVLRLRRSRPPHRPQHHPLPPPSLNPHLQNRFPHRRRPLPHIPPPPPQATDCRLRHRVRNAGDRPPVRFLQHHEHLLGTPLPGFTFQSPRTSRLADTQGGGEHAGCQGGGGFRP